MPTATTPNQSSLVPRDDLTSKENDTAGVLSVQPDTWCLATIAPTTVAPGTEVLETPPHINADTIMLESDAPISIWEFIRRCLWSLVL